ncbi:MAG: hypothetical protein PHP93_05645, partial [Kiritimatiellales bacterium]|nr:hypothetical protein [Kiritimatiellales bacterium]
IQQNSNTTYRIYDWDRVDANGKGRELHIDKAMQVIDWENNGDPRCKVCGTTIQNCEYFRLDRFKLSAEQNFPVGGTSFHALFIAEGSGTIAWDGGKETLAPGQSWLVPASQGEYTLCPDGAKLTVLCTTIP